MNCTYCAVNTSKFKYALCGSNSTYCSFECADKDFENHLSSCTLHIGGADKRKASDDDDDNRQKRIDTDETFTSISLPLAQIICGQLRVGPDWKHVLEGIECTTVGSRVATSLVRVASTRIFAEPEQSILEPIVNAIDAYGVTSTTGKFGMGFFSLLYWVVLHNAEIVVESTYETNRVYAYRAKINMKGDDLWFHVEPMEPRKHTGTFVSVTLGDRIFTEDELYEFEKQILKLKFIRGVSLEFNMDDNLRHHVENYITAVNIQNTDMEHKIEIQLENMFFSVKDYAFGITKEVLLGSLLVPSTSSKTIAMSESNSNQSYIANPIVNPIVEADVDVGVCHIMVNRIIIVSVKIESKYELIIDLPPFSRMPVSRDDVVLSSVSEHFTQNIRRLVIDLISKYRTVIPLEQAIGGLLLQTPSSENKNILASSIQTIYKYIENKRYITIDNKYEKIYSYLNLQTNTIISTLTPDVDVLDAKIGELLLPYKIQPYYNRVVIIFNGNIKISTGGTTKFIFINEKYLQKTDFETLALSFYDATMYTKKSFIKSQYNELMHLIDDIPSTDIQKAVIEILDVFTLCITNGYKLPNVWNYGTTIKELARLLRFFAKTLSFSVDFFRIFSRQYLSQYVNGPKTYIYGGVAPRVMVFGYPETFVVVPRENYLVDLGPKANGFLNDIFRYIVSKIAKHHAHITIDMIFKFVYNLFLTYGDYFKSLRNSTAIAMCDTSFKYFWVVTVMDVQRYTEAFIDQTQMNYFIGTVLDMVEKELYSKGYEPPYIFYDNGIGLNTQSPTHKKLRFAYLEFLKTMSSALTVYTGIQWDYEKYITTPTRYRLSDFISYAFKNELSRDPHEFIEQMNNIPFASDSKLQTLEISINEGTVKDIISSQLTETVQNSFDAIRSAQIRPVNPSIDIVVSRYGKNKDQLIIEISDPIGMTIDNVIALSIPFYSNKTISEIVTGEMGTGFFNVYRSDMVIIDTVKYHKRILMVDRPIRDSKTNRVVDVEREIQIQHTDDNNGTTISIITNYGTDNILLLNTMGEAQRFVNNVISLIDLKVNFNGKIVSKQLRKLYDNPTLTLYYIVGSTHDKPMSSYLMTNGIPFAPLLDYMQQMDVRSDWIVDGLRYHVVINIKSGVYTPTQTRTKLGMSDKNMSILHAFLRRSFYYINLMETDEKKLNKLFPHYKSKGSIDQLIPGSGGQLRKHNFMNQYSVNGQRSIADTLRRFVRIYKERAKTDGFTAEMYDEYYNSAYNQRPSMYIYTNIKRIVLGWLDGKKIKTKQDILKDKAQQQKDLQIVQNKGRLSLEQQIGSFITKFIDTYVKVGKKLLIFNPNKPNPSVNVVLTGNSNYDPNVNTISINIIQDKSQMNDLKIILNIFKQKNPMEIAKHVQQLQLENDTWKSLFGVLGAIPHELEHYRANSQHETGDAHPQNIEIFLPYNGKKIRNFEQNYGDTMRSLVSNGNFWENLIQ